MAKDAGTLKGGGRLIGEALRDATTHMGKRRGSVDFEASDVPVMTWEEFLRWFTWKQGEHITMLGTTGSGKTTLALELLPRRTYVTAFGTKAKDDTLSKLLRSGYMRIESWDDRPPHQISTRLLLWPKIMSGRAAEIKAKQRTVFGEALSEIYREGSWCIFLDELRYITDFLGLSEDVELIWQQGRSLGISLLAGTQRPRNIPLVAYDQATHLFFWRENDTENLKRLGGIAWTDRNEVQAIISNLPRHEFLYLNTRTGEMRISRVQL